MKGCIFCKIVNKEMDSEIVYDDNEIVAFKDINPQAPVHLLIVPKKHIEKVSDLTVEDSELAGKLVIVANKIAKEKSLTEQGYRLVFNCGRGAGQAVFHIHMHLLGGRGFRWPPG